MRVDCPGLPSDWLGPDITVEIHSLDIRSNEAPATWAWSYTSAYAGPVTYDAYIESVLVGHPAITVEILIAALRGPHEVLVADRGMVIDHEVIHDWQLSYKGNPLVTSRYRLAHHAHYPSFV